MQTYLSCFLTLIEFLRGTFKHEQRRHRYTTDKMTVHHGDDLETQKCTHSQMQLKPFLHVFGLWDEAKYPRGNQRRHKVNM